MTVMQIKSVPGNIASCASRNRWTAHSFGQATTITGPVRPTHNTSCHFRKTNDICPFSMMYIRTTEKFSTDQVSFLTSPLLTQKPDTWQKVWLARNTLSINVGVICNRANDEDTDTFCSLGRGFHDNLPIHMHTSKHRNLCVNYVVYPSRYRGRGVKCYSVAG